jgi:hypothetical protein
MNAVVRLTLAGGFVFALGATGFAQAPAPTPAPAAPATPAAPAAPMPKKPMKMSPEAMAKAKECKAKAEEQQLLGKERKDYIKKCKKGEM